MLPVQGGIYRFRATDTDGQRISINQQSLSIVPRATQSSMPETPRLDRDFPNIMFPCKSAEKCAVRLVSRSTAPPRMSDFTSRTTTIPCPWPTPLEFSRFLKPLLQISNQAEIGFSVGSATPFQVLWLSNPRIGVGFVFGGALGVWHINLPE